MHESTILDERSTIFVIYASSLKFRIDPEEKKIDAFNSSKIIVSRKVNGYGSTLVPLIASDISRQRKEEENRQTVHTCEYFLRRAFTIGWIIKRACRSRLIAVSDTNDVQPRSERSFYGTADRNLLRRISVVNDQTNRSAYNQIWIELNYTDAIQFFPRFDRSNELNGLLNL